MTESKKNKFRIFVMLATLLFSAFSILGMSLPVAAAPEHVNVTLHKRVWQDEIPKEAYQQNTGELMENFGGDPLDGVTFSVYDVTEQYFRSIREDGKTAREALERIQSDAALYKRAPDYASGPLQTQVTATASGETDPNRQGIAVFDQLPRKDAQGRDAVYLFVEEESPANIYEMAYPLLSALPVYAGDEELTEIHLYPKNILKEHSKTLVDSGRFNEVTITQDGNQVTYYDVGTDDILNYLLTVAVPRDLGNKAFFEITDTPTNGLRLTTPDSIEVLIDGVAVPSSYFTIDTATPNVGFTITFHIDNEEVVELLQGKTLTISYDMSLTGDAITQLSDNTATIDFGSDPTILDGPKVKTNEHQFRKINSHDGNPLSGAVFRIFKDSDGQVLYARVNEENVLIGWDDVGTEITSGPDGYFDIRGFKAGTYTLEEVTAPSGYVILDPYTTFEIDPTASETPLVTIENQPQGLLPETGGMGIYIFLLIGGLILLAAYVVYRQTKKEHM